MNQAKLRARFDREVDAPDKDLLWRWLEQREHVQRVCSGQESWEDFEFEASLLADHQRDMLGMANSPGRTKLPRYTDVSLTSLEEEHAAAFAAYLVRQAMFSTEVTRFRQKKLSNGTLEPEQVPDFLREELRYLPLEERTGLKWVWEEPLDPVFEEEKLKDLVGGWEYRTEESKAKYAYEAFREGFELDSMKIPIEPEYPYLFGVMHLVRDHTGTTLEDVGRHLVSRYPWSLRDGAWFVLTGEPPAPTPLKVKSSSLSGAHTIAFAPWISEKTVRRAYRSVQEGDNRPLGRKSLATFRFVFEHTKPGQTPKWSELTRLWNEQHPDDKFRDRSAFRKAYERARERLTSPWVNEQTQNAEVVDAS